MISLAVFLQGIEILLARKNIAKIWRFFIPEPIFVLIIGMQLICSVLFAFTLNSVFLWPMLVGTVLTAWRFRGTFNGGADYMTVTVLIGFLLPKPWGFWFIAVQLILSYVIAGLVKLKSPFWRNGSALKALMTKTNYAIPMAAQNWIQNSKLSLFLSWALMIFECSFFLTLWKPEMALVYMAVGVIFHLGNFWIFGLNRFFFAWLAAYPALYWASHQFILS